MESARKRRRLTDRARIDRIQAACRLSLIESEALTESDLKFLSRGLAAIDAPRPATVGFTPGAGLTLQLGYDVSADATAAERGAWIATPSVAGKPPIGHIASIEPDGAVLVEPMPLPTERFEHKVRYL